MEEKNTKNDNKKEIKSSIEMMHDGKGKLTYEQLNDTCNQLWLQNRQLVARNEELKQFIANNRLNYLFNVLEFSSKFSSDFIGDCIEEIEEALTIPATEKKNKED